MLTKSEFFKHLAIGTRTDPEVRQIATYLHLSGMPVQVARSYLTRIIESLNSTKKQRKRNDNATPQD